jgi:hypothetical protein
MPAAKRYRDILLDEDATASAVFESAKRVLGPGFVAWEPETIWLDLADEDVDVDLENRDKLLACITLLVTRSFYWDAAVFENTSMAFNDIPSAPEALQEASPAEMSWAVFEAQYLLRREYQNEGEFDYEPAKYAAVSLFRAGFLVAPEMLSFAQEELDRLNQGHRDLKPQVEQRWSKLDKTKLTELELDETPLDIQTGYLAAVHLYVEERARRLKREIASLD